MDKVLNDGAGRPDLNLYFMRMARLVATRSTCLRRAVGCVLVDERGHVLSTGYNGVAAGDEHCNQGQVTNTLPEAIGLAAYKTTDGVDDYWVLPQGHTANEYKTIGHDKEFKVKDGWQGRRGDIVKVEYPHACEGAFAKSGTSLNACAAVHAEQNALLQCPDVKEIHAAYVTTAPCDSCLKLFLNTGCKLIIVGEWYYLPDGSSNEEAVKERWTKKTGERLVLLDDRP